MHKMVAPLFLLALLIIPSDGLRSSPLTVAGLTVDQKLVAISGWLSQWSDLSLRDIELLVGNAILTADWEELVKTVQVIQNVTSQLLIDLQVLKGRQAVSGAVQGGQVFMFVAYLVTIAVLCLVKHCNKHRERLAQSEFELLEAKLQSNKAKRRAAAARAKSAPGPSPK